MKSLVALVVRKLETEKVAKSGSVLYYTYGRRLIGSEEDISPESVTPPTTGPWVSTCATATSRSKR